MGPVGFEPTTKGFTLPRRFRREWTISSPVHQSGACGCGMLQACYQGRSSPQVVSAPSAGVPAARLRVAMDTQVPEGFPEFIPSTSRVSARRHLIDESPALTAVLQAQRPAIVAAPLPQEWNSPRRVWLCGQPRREKASSMVPWNQAISLTL